jgi:hypothetical protein
MYWMVWLSSMVGSYGARNTSLVFSDCVTDEGLEEEEEVEENCAADDNDDFDEDDEDGIDLTGALYADVDDTDCECEYECDADDDGSCLRETAPLAIPVKKEWISSVLPV